MNTPFQERLKAVDTALLTPLVRQLLADDCAEVLDWHYARLDGGMVQARGGSCGLYRFRGQARTHGDVRTWSLVLKATAAAVVAATPIATAAESDSYYWKREVLVYESGLLADLPPGIVAPRCFGVAEYPGQEFWIWLEDIEDHPWSRLDYGLAAYHLGQFNGAYLVGRPIPRAPWLSSGQVRTWMEWAEAGISDIERLRHLPVHHCWLDEASVSRILRLWADRERLFAGLDRLPRCFCHHDAFRRNLMLRCSSAGVTETVAIDWAAAGTGGVGTEMAAMIGNAVTFYEIAPRAIKEFEAVVWSGYCGGLRNAGWQGDPQLARFGFAATTALLQGLGLAGLLISLFADPEEIRFHERFFGRPIGELMAQRAIFHHYLLDLGEEALILLKQLDLADEL